jgi:uncharacterized protein YndB with AHSA1/START domain
MPTLRLSQTINRPTSDVFRVIADVANLARWNPTITAARQLSQGAVGNGTSFEMTVRGFGRVAQTLEEFEQNRRARYVPHFGVMSGGHRFQLTSLGSETRVDHELEMTPKGWFRIFSPFLGMMGRKNLRATADALKQYVEHLPAS